MCDREQRDAMAAFAEGFSSGKEIWTSDFLAEDIVASHWRWGDRTLEGKEKFETQYHAPLLEAFPDVDFDVNESYIGENSVVLRGEFNGTFTKEWENVPPHGRPVHWRAHDIYLFKNGKVERMWLGNDTLNVARQIGALPDDGKPW